MIKIYIHHKLKSDSFGCSTLEYQNTVSICILKYEAAMPRNIFT